MATARARRRVRPPCRCRRAGSGTGGPGRMTGSGPIRTLVLRTPHRRATPSPIARFQPHRRTFCPGVRLSCRQATRAPARFCRPMPGEGPSHVVAIARLAHGDVVDPSSDRRGPGQGAAAPSRARDRAPPRGRDGGRGGGPAGQGPARQPAAHRRGHAGRLALGVARRPAAGPPPRRPAAGEALALLRPRGAGAGAGDRRQHGGVQRGERGAAQAAPGPSARTTWPACCWRDRPRGGRRSASASRWGPAGGGWCGNW